MMENYCLHLRDKMKICWHKEGRTQRRSDYCRRKANLQGKKGVKYPPNSRTGAREISVWYTNADVWTKEKLHSTTSDSYIRRKT